MTCKCGSRRLVLVSGKVSDLCHLTFLESGKWLNGYVPYDMGIGGGDYLKFNYCLNCGQIQGIFPIEEQEGLEEDSDEN